MTAKQCLRHDWLRGAPTQASPHLRRYLSKSREVLLERVVSRENLRRATLLSQAKSHANLSEGNCNKGNQGLGGNLSQSEICLSYGMTGSQMSLPGSEDGIMSPAHSQISLESTSQNTFALSQSCLLNKEQTQGLLSQAQSKSHANLSHGPSRGLLSRMRNLSETQSQVCLLNMAKNIPRHVLNPLFSRSRDKLYGLKSLSKSQGVLDIYRSLECLKKKKNQRARTEDILPIFKQLSAEIAASNASLQRPMDWNLDFGQDYEIKSTENGDKNSSRQSATPQIEKKAPELSEEVVKTNPDQFNGRDPRGIELPEVKNSQPEHFDKNPNSKTPVIIKTLEFENAKQPDSEGNLDSLQSVESIESVESDTLTEDSDETPSRLSVKQPSQRQNSDISSHSNNSGNSDDKEDHSESENDEPKYTVAQLVSAFNKHQEVASKTSLEAIMTEKRVNEVNFPTGPKALRLFIPDINITESTIVRRKTSYKPRKNWEELRKMNERNEGVTKRNFDDSGNEDEDDDDNKTPVDESPTVEKENIALFQSTLTPPIENVKIVETFDGSQDNNQDATSVAIKISPEIENVGEAGSLENHESAKIDEKYRQCVHGVAASKAELSDKLTIKEKSTEPVTVSLQCAHSPTKPAISSPNEKVANYIFAEVTTSKKGEKVEPSTTACKALRKDGSTKFATKVDNNVNLKDILQRVDNSQTSPRENLENLRKRTSIAKIILNDNLAVDDDANNNGTTSLPIHRAKSEPPLIVPPENRKMQLDIPPSFVRSASLSSEGSCLTPSSVQSDMGISWEDVRVNKGQSQIQTQSCTVFLQEAKNQKRVPGWETPSAESHKGQLQTDAKKESTISLEEKKIWGKVCTGSYTRAMEKFNGKSPTDLSSKKSSNLLSTSHGQTEKTRRKSSPAMPQCVNP